VNTERLTQPAARAAEWAETQKRRYAHGEDRPLGGYVATMTTYSALVAAGALSVARSGRPLPERFLARDLALLAVAVHKTSRLLAKDPVTSPLRAPVARFEGVAGPAELDEEVRGEGHAHAIGELVTCPFCLSQWLATAGVFGLVLAPRPTRFLASLMAVVAGSDFLQHVYAAAQQRTS
jgi:hypothetical protein